MKNNMYVIRADSGKEACEEVESEIEDWGDENNWRNVYAAIPEKGQAYIRDKEEGKWVKDSTIENLNSDFKKILIEEPLVSFKDVKRDLGYLMKNNKMPKSRTKGEIEDMKWWRIKEWAKEMGTRSLVSKKEPISVLTHEFHEGGV